MNISKIQTTRVYKKVILIFSICTVILLGLIVYYSFSKTIITITLNPQKITTSFYATIDGNLDSESVSSQNALSGTLVFTEVTDSMDFTNTNQGSMVEEPATGTVTIYNNWSENQPLMATTRFLTSNGILFRLKERVDVPAGGQLDNVEVYADQPGASGNIEPTKFTIPGLWPGLQEKIYAQSTKAMTGGLREAKVITQDLIDQSEQALINALTQTAKEQLAADNNQSSMPEQAIFSSIKEQAASANLGDEIDTLTLDMTLIVNAITFDEKKLTAMGLEKVEEQISQDEKINQYSGEELIYEIDEFDLDNQKAELIVKFTAYVVPRLSNSIFNREKITKKDSQGIKAYFSNFDQVQDVEIHFSPFWVSKAPGLIDHIEIKIKE